MAKSVGISVRSLSLVERGVIPPRLGDEGVRRLCFFFGFSVSEMHFVSFEKRDKKGEREKGQLM